MSVAVSGSIAKESWITPDEQLDRLLNPILKTLCEVQPQLDVNALRIIAEYASTALTNWHTALERLGLLDEKIPPLPWNIHQILDDTCPLPKRMGQELKSDGTHWKVGDTHSLYLLSAGSLNELAARVHSYGEAAMNAQGERLYPRENPLGFRYFSFDAREEHGDVPFEAEWILMSNDVLEESRKQSWYNQVNIIQNLSAKAFVEYQAPSVKQAFGFMVLHKVATGESLYQLGNEENNHLSTYTRVIHRTEGYPLVIGGFTPSGGCILINCYDNERVGVAGLRKF